jgi:hypothetical protein
MRSGIAVLIAIMGAMAASAAEPSPSAVYSNEEQVYFAREAKADPPLTIHVRVAGEAGKVRATALDAFGKEAALPTEITTAVAAAFPLGAEKGSGRLTLHFGATQYELRRARPATCWVAIRKDKPKADGSPDWHFERGVTLHDQGGRALVGSGVADTSPVMIRMRNVVWPANADGTPNVNKPSIVLYVHKPDQYDRSEAYVWGDPGAARIGINLRWMQASCGIDGMEAPAAVTATSFRG